MNSKRYQIIFSTRLNALVVVGENCTRSGKSVGESSVGSACISQFAPISRFVGLLALGLALFTNAFADPLAHSLPTGGVVAQGAATISQSANAMVIHQDTAKAIVNWQSFDIGAAASVNVIQPSTESVLLNRVVTNNPSQIFGSLNASGQVILINPNGILFGKDGSVNANAFTASTLDMRDADFMAGNYRYFSTGVHGEILNQGGINTQQYVALLGAKVTNDGAINTRGGNVYLGSAEAITVPVSNSGRIKMELSPASINAAVENTQNGVIVSQGGQVYIQASSLNDAVASLSNEGQIDTGASQAGSVHLLADGGLINVSGSIKANSTGQDENNQLRKGGDIIIGRDSEAGVLAKSTNVSGARFESNQGFVETSGDWLATYGTRVAAKDWLLDPTNITIAASGASGTAYSANYTAGADSVILAADINASLNAGTGVTVATSAAGASSGNIAVNESIAKTAGANTSLTLKAHGDITVAANKTITSTVGKLDVVLNSDFDANGSGAIAMATGSGIASNGGNISLGGGSAGSATSYAAGYASVLSGVSLVSSNLTAGGGNISIKGKGNTVFTNTSSMMGVDLNGTTISTTGIGTIAIDGFGGNGNVSNTNVGISLTNSAMITAGTGAITMTGTATTTAGGYYNSGIWLYGSGSKVTGAGAISLTGVGGGSTYASLNQGVRLEGGQVIATGTGTVTLSGTSGTTTGTAGPNAGVEISSGGVAKTDTGNIRITGLSGTTGATDVLLSGAGSVSSNSGNVTFTANSYSGDNTEIVNAGTGIVTMQNRTAGTLIDVGGADASGTLGISNAEIGRVTAGSIVIGSVAQQTGNLTVSSAIDTTGASKFSLISTGGIAVNNNIAKTTAGATTLNLQANANIIVAANKTISSSSGALNTILNANSAGTGGAIVFNAGSGITSKGGNITFGGGTTLDGTGFAVADGTNTLQGISLNTVAINAGGGNIVMNGQTAATNYQINLSNVAGIYMNGGTMSTTGSGTITLTGKNKNTDTQSQGFVLASGTITGGATGVLSITGDSSGVASSTSTYIRGALINGTVTSAGGNISVTGFGGAGAQWDYGIDISGSVNAVGAGTLSITGTAGAGASGGNVGVNTSGAGTISSVDGAISITGTGGIGNGAQIRDHGVQIGGSNAVKSTGTGSITVTGSATNSDNGYSLGVAINAGGLNANSGNVKIDGTVPANYQVADYINAPITSTSGNVYIRSAGANIQNTTTGTITGNNVSIDNTGGTIDASGVITKGAGGASFMTGVGQDGINIKGSVTATNNVNIYGNQTGSSVGVNIAAAISGKNLTINGNSGSGTGITIASSITATGNVSILGNVTTITSTGVNLTSAASVTGSGTAAAINISANGNVVNAAVIKDTGATGTGSSINITSTSGNISGTGAIGDTTNKNSDVTFTQSGTSTYDGAINGANFTKAGTGALTLDSWALATPINTNISNAYNVQAGGLTLSPGATYAQLNPISVNVNNASTFSVSSAGNGWWKNTAFNFTGGSGGGTMNLGGNPIGSSGTTNTFSSSGGATNTITGMINANSADVNLNLTIATSGTTLVDGSFAAIAFTQNTQGGYGLQNAITVNVAGGGSLLFKDKLGSTNLNINAGVVQMGDGSALATATTADLAVTNVAIASGAKLVFNRAEAYANASVITGAGSLIQGGVGIVTLTGNSSAFAGATTVNAGKTLAIGTGGSLGAAGSTLTLTNATSNLLFTNTSGTSTVSSTISGLGTVTENGVGGIGLLLANNTYTGVTTTTAGTLQVGNGGTVGSLGTGAVTDNSALVFNRSDNITVSNTISGTGTVTQAGTGKLLFPSNNAGYTGQTYVNAGILSFGTPSTTGTAASQYWSSQFNVAAGAVLDFNSPTGVTLNNQGTIFTGAGTITKTGGGGLTWNVTNTFFNMLAGSLIDVQQGSMTGSTTYHGNWTNNLSSLNVAAGASFLGAEGDTRVDALTGAGSISSGWTTLGSLTVGVNNTAAGTFNSTAGTASFSGVLSGPAPLNKIGTGTQILTGANNYSGATNINAGTLQVGDGGTTGTLGTGAVVDDGNLTINRSNAYTIANAISGTGTLNQIGTGTTTLTATNTYSGTTTISAGTLQVGNGTTVGTLGTGNVVDNGILAINHSDAVTLTQAISGTGSLLQMGTGTTKLASNANTFSGGITISKGAVMIGNGGGTNGNYNLNSGSGTITLGDANTGTSNVALQIESGTGLGQAALANNIVVSSQGTGTATIGSVVGSGSGTFTEVKSLLTLNRDVTLNDATTDRLGYSGKITGTGNISITGTRVSMGTTNSNGVSSNDFVGNVTIASGSILQAGAKSLFPITTNIIDNGTLRLLDGNYQAINALSGTGTITTLNTSGGLVTDLSIGNNNGGATFAGTITGSSPVLTLTKNGTGTQILSGANTYTGATTINAGTLQIGNGSNTGTLGANGTVYSAVSVAVNANLDFYRNDAAFTIPNNISGAGAVNFKGTGIQGQSSYYLTGNNSSLSGSINVLPSSRIAITAANQVGTAGITINSGAGIYTNGAFTINNALSLAGNGWNESTGYLGAMRLQNGTNYAGPITLAADARIGAYGSTGTVSGVISGANTVDFNSGASGTVILTGNNTYTGSTTISAGTLQVGNGGTTGTLGTGAYIDNASLVFNRSNALLVSNAISGTGALSQTGAGTTTLAADNTYAGTTTVSGGTLQVGNAGTTGTLGAGAVTLSNNANLNYVRAASTTIANNISGAGSVSATITGASSNLTVDHMVNLTGGTVNLVTDANLSVTQAIRTTNTTSAAVFLEAGKATAAGTSNGGDVTISGSGAVTVGTGGRATIETGSVAGSTGLGVAAGNSRFNSDEAATNYTTALGAGTYVIYREAPTLTATVNSASKTYDGQVYSGGYSTSSLTGFVNGDTNAQLGAVTYGGTSQTAVNFGNYAISASALSGVGYNVAYTSGTLAIGKANLTLSGTRVYDAGNTFAGNYLTATGVNSESFTVTGSGDATNLLSKNVQTNQVLNSVTGLAVGMSNGTNTGLSSNYNALSTVGSSVSVTKKTATVAGTATNLTYNGNTQNQLAETRTDFIAGDAITVSGQASGKNAGTFASNLAVAGTDAGNYNITVTNADLVIGKANLILSGTRVYDASSSFAGSNLTATGVAGETFAVAGSGGTTNLASKNVQTNQALNSLTGLSLGSSANGGLSANYNALSTTGSSVSVTAKAATVNATVTNLTYNGSTQNQLAETTSGFIANDTITISGQASGKNAGTYASNLSVAGADAGNYNITVNNANLAIAKATLTATGNSGTVTYNGDSQSVSGFTLSALQGGDTATDLSSISATGATGKNVGSYTNIVTAGTETNYTVSTANGALTIGKTDLVLSGTRVYDAGTTFAGQYLTATGVHGETFAVTGTGDASNLTSKSVHAGLLNSVTGLALGGSGNGGSSSNYNNISTTNSSVSVTAKTATVTGTPTNLTYNGGVQNQTVESTNGFITGDAITISGSASGTNAGTYASNLAVIGVDAGNYSTTINNADLVIGKANLTLSGTRVYDGSASFAGSNLTATGVAGETFTVTGSGNNSNLTSKDVQTHQPLNSVTGLNLGSSANGGLSGNYNDLSTTGSSVSVTPKVLSGSLISVAQKTYNGTDVAALANGNFSLTGWVSGEGATVNQTLGTYDSQNVSANGGFAGTGPLGNVTATLSAGQLTGTGGTNISNYTVPSSVSGAIGKITPAALNIQVKDTQMFVTQDANNAKDMGFTFTGLVGSDTASSVLTASLNRSYTDSTARPVAGHYAGVYGLANPPVAVGDNYSINVTTGNLDVLPAGKLLIAVSSQTDTYGNRTATNAGTAAAGTVTAQYCLDSRDCSGVNLVDLTMTRLDPLGINWSARDSSGVTTTLNTSIIGTYSTGGYLNAGNYTYSVGNVTSTGQFTGTAISGGTLAIDRLSITPTVGAISRPYDGTNLVNGQTLTVSQVKTNDIVTASTAGGTFVDKNVQTNSSVNYTGLSLAGTDSANYSLAVNTVTGTGSITPKTVSLSATKVYDSNTDMTGKVTINTGIAGETLNYTGATVNDKDVLDARYISAIMLTDGTGLASNYQTASLTQGTAGLNTASVTPKLASVTGTATNLTYNGATQSQTAQTSSGFIAGDNIAFSGSRSEKNAGTYTSNLVVGGTDASNYTTTITNADLVIGKAQLMATGNSGTVTYNGANQSVAGFTLSGLLGSDTAASLSATSASGTTAKNVGTYTNTVAAGNETNYIVTAVNGVLTIEKANLSATGTIVYDATTNFAGSNLTNITGVNGETFTATGAGTLANPNVQSGQHLASLGTLSLAGVGSASTSNYNALTTAQTSVSVTPRTLTVTGANHTVTYNGNTQNNSGASYTGNQGSDSFTISGYGSGTNAGTYTDSLSVAGVGSTAVNNYSIQYNNRGLTIDKAALIATGNSGSGNYTGSSQSIAGFTVSGLKGTDSVGSLTSIVASGVSGVNAGSYTNTVTAGTETNYIVSTVNGTLAIGKANLILSGTRVYDASTTFAGQYLTATGVAGETFAVTGLGDATNLTSKNVTAQAQPVSLISVTGLVLGVSSNGGLSDNYNTLSTARSSVSVTPKALTMTITATDKVYDGSVNATISKSSADVISGDVVNLNNTTATFSDKNVARDANGVIDKTVTATGLTIDGTDANNYTLQNNTATATAKITPANLTISGITAADKTYNGDATATVNVSAARFAGLVSGDAVTVAATGTFSDKDAANNKTVTLVSTHDGADVGNYTITDQATTLANITPKALSVSLIGTAEKVYDGLQNATLRPTNFSLSGWVGSEGADASVTQTAGMYADKNVSANAGTGAVSASLVASQVTVANGTLISNYTVPTTVTGNIGKITPAALGIKVNNTAMFVTQDANTAVDNGFTFTGLVNGESATEALGATTLTRAFVGSTLNPQVSNTPQVGSYNAVYGLASTPTAANGNYNITVTKGDLEVVAADKLLVNIQSERDVYGNRNNSTAAKAATVTAQYCLSQANCTGNNFVSLSMATPDGINWIATDNTNNQISLVTAIHGGSFSTGRYLKFGNYTYDATNIASSNPGQFTGSYVNGGVLSIDQLHITPTAANVSRTYNASTLVDGMALNTLEMKTGDSLTANTAGGSFANKDVQTNTNVAYSNITLGGDDKNNYALSLDSNGGITGQGSITPKTVSLSATKVYDGSEDMTGKVVVETGIVGESLSYSSATVNNKNVTGASYISAIGLTDGSGLTSNYVAPTSAGTNNVATVTQATLSASLQGTVQKTYDGNTNATLSANNFNVQGWVQGEGATVTQANGTYSSKNVLDNVRTGAVSATIGANDWAAQSGTVLGNYVLPVSAAGNVGLINQKAVTLASINANSKTYDGSTAAVITSGNVVGSVGSETLLVSGAGTFDTKNAGTGKTVTADVASLSKINGTGDWANYNLTTTGNITTTADVNKKALTLSNISAADKKYDGTTSAVVTLGSLLSLVGNEQLLMSASSAFADANVGANKSVLVNILLADGLNGDLASNYTLSFANPFASISKDNAPFVNPVSPNAPISPSQSGGSSSRIANQQSMTENVKPEVVAKQCSVENPEACGCQNTLVPGVSLCMAPLDDASVVTDDVNLKLSKQ